MKEELITLGIIGAGILLLKPAEAKPKISGGGGGSKLVVIPQPATAPITPSNVGLGEGSTKKVTTTQKVKADDILKTQFEEFKKFSTDIIEKQPITKKRVQTDIIKEKGEIYLQETYMKEYLSGKVSYETKKVYKPELNLPISKGGLVGEVQPAKKESWFKRKIYNPITQPFRDLFNRIKLGVF